MGSSLEEGIASSSELLPIYQKLGYFIEQSFQTHLVK